jgi:metal-responsive CopG/Arc/MetJ family transcriptional regulator
MCRIRVSGGQVARGEGFRGLDHGYTIGYTSPMKTAISIPDDLFQAAEKLARRLKISRSELYQRAVAHFLEQHGGDVVRESLNRVYAKKSNRGLDPLIKAAGEHILTDDEW